MNKEYVCFRLGGPDVDEVAQRLPGLITAKLEQLAAVNVVTDIDRVRFKGGAFRPVMNMNLLCPITCGEVRIERRDDGAFVVFHASIRQLLIVGLLATALFLGVAVVSAIATPEKPASYFVPILVAVLVWPWLIGVNLLIMRIRFRYFLKRCIYEAGGRIED